MALPGVSCDYISHSEIKIWLCVSPGGTTCTTLSMNPEKENQSHVIRKEPLLPEAEAVLSTESEGLVEEMEHCIKTRDNTPSTVPEEKALQ